MSVYKIANPTFEYKDPIIFYLLKCKCQLFLNTARVFYCRWFPLGPKRGSSRIKLCWFLSSAFIYGLMCFFFSSVEKKFSVYLIIVQKSWVFKLKKERIGFHTQKIKFSPKSGRQASCILSQKIIRGFV